jgi:hypothetical protein
MTAQLLGISPASSLYPRSMCEIFVDCANFGTSPCNVHRDTSICSSSDSPSKKEVAYPLRMVLSRAK